MIFQNKHYREIEKEYEDRKASISFALSEQNEADIQKGIVNDIGYSDSELKYVSKKGSEIKEKLSSYKSKLAIELAEVSVKAKSIKKEIGFEPTGEAESYEETKTENKVYDYDQIYSENVSVDDMSGEKSVTGRGDEEKKKMREYNNCIYNLNRKFRDIKYLDTVINNIKENKEYKLNFRVASDLGF